MGRNRKRWMLSFLTIVLTYQFLLLVIRNEEANDKNNHNTKTVLVDQENVQPAFASTVEFLLNAVGKRLFDYTLGVITNGETIVNQPYPGAKIYNDYTIVQWNLKPFVNVKPFRSEFGVVVNDITAFKYSIDIPKCRKETTANRTLLLVLFLQRITLKNVKIYVKLGYVI